MDLAPFADDVNDIIAYKKLAARRVCEGAGAPQVRL